MASSSIYVETRVRAPLDRLWAATQDPALHARWDVRFTSIRYEQPEQPDEPDGRPRAYRYSLRVLPGLVVAGTGVSAGERRRPDGTRTSALRYASPDPLSLIRDGSGWWRYVPQPDGSVRFLTGYDYRPGWGPLGRPVDLAFRPLLGWATAWSFDRLRGWLDDDIDPARALRLSLAGVGLRGAAVVGAGRIARSPRGGRGGSEGTVSRTALALGLAALALVAPPLPGAPRASRCLRRPPDRLGARAPALHGRVQAS